MKKRIAIILVIVLLAINLAGCSIEKKMEKANELVGKGKYEEAINIYKEIIEKEPTYYESYLELAKVYKYIGSLDIIEKTLLDGMKSAEEKVPLQLYLIDFYLDCFEYEKAEKNALEILESDNKNVQAYEKLLQVYDQLQDYEKLKSTYGEHSYIESEKGVLYLAKAYLIQGEKDMAAKLINALDQKKIERIPLYHVVNLGINNEKQLELIESQTGDINGDGKKENILLLASYNGGMASEVIDLVIQDSRNGSIIDTISLSDFMGYPYNLKLVDANNDKILDVLVSVHSGGSSDGRYHRLLSYVDNNVKDYIGPIGDVNCTFLDDYKAKVFSEKANKSHIVEFDDERKGWYYDAGYYNRDGELLEDNLGYMHEGDVDPVFIPELNKFGLKTAMHLKGPWCNGDYICVFDEIALYENGEWITYDLNPKEDNVAETNEESSEEVAEITEDQTDTVDDEDVFTKDLEYIDEIFSLNRNEIYEKFGEPTDTGYFETEYLGYDNFYIYISQEEVSCVQFFEGSEMFGIKISADADTIKAKLGEPTSEWGADEDDEGDYDYGLVYEKGKYSLYFLDANGSDEYFLHVQYKN